MFLKVYIVEGDSVWQNIGNVIYSFFQTASEHITEQV